MEGVDVGNTGVGSSGSLLSNGTAASLRLISGDEVVTGRVALCGNLGWVSGSGWGRSDIARGIESSERWVPLRGLNAFLRVVLGGIASSLVLASLLLKD
jgi:hypothetical protein